MHTVDDSARSLYGHFAYEGTGADRSMALVRHCLPSNILAGVTKPTLSAISTERSMADPDFEMRQRDLDDAGLQGSLFPNDELIIPNSVRTLKKAVAAIHAIPAKAEYAQSLNDRRIFDACILIAQLECRGRESEIVQRLKTDRISPMFEVRISTIAELAGITGKNYQRLYESLDNLFSMTLNWNICGEDGSVTWEMRSHYFSVLGYGRNFKKGYVRFAYDASVLELILEPSVWTKLSLDVMWGLRTSAAYALYQNAFRYLGTQNKVTAALPTHVWVELLVGKSRYVSETNGRIVVNYGDFKRRVLEDAIRRVNEAPALSYTLKLRELKSGNRVAKLQFEFIPKRQRALALPLTWPSDVVRLLEQMQYGRQEIDDLSQAHSVEEVAEAITRLQVSEQRQREKGRPIVSRRAYFEGILRNISSGAAAEQVDHDRIIEEVRIEEARKSAETRMERLKGQFEKHQRDRFAQWLFERSEDERTALVEAFRNSLESNPGARMMMKRAITPSDFSSQALLRAWMAKARPEVMETALPAPEDRTFENWMAWKLSGGDAIDA